MPNLERFLIAQEINYESAKQELQRGRKESHWMWYVFPQITGLSSSGMGRKYAIADLKEAKEYASHEVLGKRLHEMCQLLLNIDGNDAYLVLGSPDNMKLKSSMTLFAMAEPENPIYQQVLDKYFDGEMDKRTVQLLKLLKGLY